MHCCSLKQCGTVVSRVCWTLIAKKPMSITPQARFLIQVFRIQRDTPSFVFDWLSTWLSERHFYCGLSIIVSTCINHPVHCNCTLTHMYLIMVTFGGCYIDLYSFSHPERSSAIVHTQSHTYIRSWSLLGICIHTHTHTHTYLPTYQIMVTFDYIDLY